MVWMLNANGWQHDENKMHIKYFSVWNSWTLSPLLQGTQIAFVKHWASNSAVQACADLCDLSILAAGRSEHLLHQGPTLSMEHCLLTWVPWKQCLQMGMPFAHGLLDFYTCAQAKQALQISEVGKLWWCQSPSANPILRGMENTRNTRAVKKCIPLLNYALIACAMCFAYSAKTNFTDTHFLFSIQLSEGDESCFECRLLIICFVNTATISSWIDHEVLMCWWEASTFALHAVWDIHLYFGLVLEHQA